MSASKPDVSYFLDTNIFLRFFHNSYPKSFTECQSLIEMIKLGQISAVTSFHVLSEIAYTLKSYYRCPKTEILKYLQSIIGLHNLTIHDDIQINTVINYFTKLNIKYVDCLIASSKNLQSGKWQLVSYDTDFDKIKGLRRLEPRDVI